MNSGEGNITNFVFVTTQVSYKELSDIAMKHQMSVTDFVSRAILEHIAKVENLNQPANCGQEEAR